MPITWQTKPDEALADLAVVIVPWNVREKVLGNLRALAASTGDLVVRVVLVDNASTDGTADAIRQEFPWVRIIANPENVGFSRANLQGALAAPARHVLLLNPDMQVEPGALAETVRYLDAHPEVAVVSGLLHQGDGKVLRSVRRFPTVVSQLVVLLKLGWIFREVMRRYHADDVDLSHEQAVDSVRGSFFGINRTALDRLGLLDTRFFLWFEEVDFCRFAHARGMKVMHAPSIRATDFIGQSFAQRPTYWKQRVFSQSMVQYFEKWHPWWQSAVLKAVRVFVLAPFWVVDAIWRT